MLGFLFLHVSSKTTTTHEYTPLEIGIPHVFLFNKPARNFTKPEYARSFLTSIVGSESAESLIKKIKASKSSSTNKVEFKAAPGTSERRFSQTYTVINVIKFNNGVIQCLVSTVEAEASVKSELIIKTSTKRFLRKTRVST